MSTRSPTVLLAHESAEMRAFLGEQLPGHYQVRPAAEKSQALRELRREEPDLMVVDTDLEEARALCREAKREVSELPVVLLAKGSAKEQYRPEPTTEGPTAEEEKAPPAGAPSAAGPWADGALEKPFATETFRRHVEKHLPGGQAGIKPLDRGRPGSEGIAEKVLAVIERRLADPDLTVDEMAKAVGVSRRHLTRRLKAATGKTPAALLRARRIERAKQKLRAGPETIAGVAQAVGFRSPSHFSQVFRKQVGSTPSAYLQEHASGAE